MSTKTILETLGLDLIPYALGVSKFKSDAPFEPTKLQDISELVQGLDMKKLDDALKFSKELLDDESARGEKTENKAYNLIGITGVSAAFITGISSLLPKESQIVFPLLIVLLLVFYLFIVISLTLTVLLASRVVLVRNYTYPDISDVFKMGSQSLAEAKLDRLTTYVYCYAKNFQTHNIKVSYLIGAQLWFRNSIIVFLVLAFMLIPSFLGGTTTAQLSLTETPSPTFALQKAQTAIPVTQTFTPPTTNVHPTNTKKPIATPTPTSAITRTSTDVLITHTATP